MNQYKNNKNAKDNRRKGKTFLVNGDELHDKTNGMEYF